MTEDIKVYRVGNSEHQSQQATMDIKVYTQKTKVETSHRMLKNTQMTLKYTDIMVIQLSSLRRMPQYTENGVRQSIHCAH